jgi:hypothetical protein
MIWSFWQEQLYSPVVLIAFTILNSRTVNGPRYGAHFRGRFINFRHGRMATSIFNIPHVFCSPLLLSGYHVSLTTYVFFCYAEESLATIVLKLYCYRVKITLLVQNQRPTLINVALW